MIKSQGKVLTPEETSKILQMIKKKKSRLDSVNPNVVDFKYHGNANSFAHLLKNHFGKPPTPVELNFECQLRTYR